LIEYLDSKKYGLIVIGDGSLKPDFSYSNPRKTNSFHKWIYTLMTAYKWMKKNSSNIIIHDLFATRGIIFQRKKKQ